MTAIRNRFSALILRKKTIKRRNIRKNLAIISKEKKPGLIAGAQVVTVKKNWF